MMESAQEFLIKKGFRKVHQPNKRYNLSIAELIEFLDEYAQKAVKNGSKRYGKNGHSNGNPMKEDYTESSHTHRQVNG
jgi:hypothetical protein